MDAARERVVGKAEWPVFRLLQEEADRAMGGREGGWEGGGQEEEEEEEEEEEGERVAPLM